MRLLTTRPSDLMCRTVRGVGATAGGALPGPLATHVSECLRCQAELARYRRLRRELGRLAQRREVAPISIAARVDHTISPQLAVVGRPSQNARRAATIVGATAAAASTAAFALWRRTRAAAPVAR